MSSSHQYYISLYGDRSLYELHKQTLRPTRCKIHTLTLNIGYAEHRQLYSGAGYTLIIQSVYQAGGGRGATEHGFQPQRANDELLQLISHQRKNGGSQCTISGSSPRLLSLTELMNSRKSEGSSGTPWSGHATYCKYTFQTDLPTITYTQPSLVSLQTPTNSSWPWSTTLVASSEMRAGREGRNRAVATPQAGPITFHDVRQRCLIDSSSVLTRSEGLGKGRPPCDWQVSVRAGGNCSRGATRPGPEEPRTILHFRQEVFILLRNEEALGETEELPLLQAQVVAYQVQQNNTFILLLKDGNNKQIVND
ncbi:hypothetical protein F7725_018493 [Dissostichus mawsoni]|uniref:Uncharacterized protein n=1 Tax=Dissostichus mawsoni TaxID=36200 RepID=A0A7J5XRL1_DISMA|nr:hypothetical protein F7725_018493 [Dissostichus mawsoni]